MDSSFLFYIKHALIVLFLLNLIATTTTDAMFVQPTFDRSSENVTVIIGNSAVLPCFISNLGDHKVAWIKVANMDILAIGDYRVTNDDRIKLLHGYLSDWSLSIQPVNEEDSGEYICQVNTEPQIITRIFLQVLLPPKIIEEKSSLSAGPIQETQTLKLQCHADGIPSPKVTWYFRKKVSHHLNNLSHHVHQPHSFDLSQTSHNAKYFEYQTILVDENSLTIKNISRSFSGLFECIANNSVPPAASRKIRISVEFAPEVSVPTDKIEQIVGLDTRFECKIKANPLINHYWMKDGQVIESSPDTLSDSKYEINIYNQNSIDYLTVSVLLIKNISKNDFGVYQCFAVNGYNTSKAEIELKEIVMRRQHSTAKISESRILFYSNLQSNNKENANDLFATQRIQASSTPAVSGLITKHLLYSPKLTRKTLNHTSKQQQQQINKIKHHTNLDQEKETMFSLFNSGFKLGFNVNTFILLNFSLTYLILY